MKNIFTILDMVSSKRDGNFSEIYKKLMIFSDKIKVLEEVLRTCKLQIACANVPYSSVEEYYHRSTYVPYLYKCSSSLKEQFKSPPKKHCIITMCLAQVLCEEWFWFFRDSFLLLLSRFILPKKWWRIIILLGKINRVNKVRKHLKWQFVLL